MSHRTDSISESILVIATDQMPDLISSIFFLIYCRSSESVSDRIARAFSRAGVMQAVALDISRSFDRVWQTGLLHKLKSYGIIFDLISSFLSNRWLLITRISS